MCWPHDALKYVLLCTVGCTPSDDRPVAVRLEAHVRELSETCSPRDHRHPANLKRAADYINEEFLRSGLTARYQEFSVDGETYYNVRAFLGAPRSPRVVVGAHYDAVEGTPGASNYHEASDTYDTLDYERMSEAVTAIAKAVTDLAPQE